MSIVLPKEKNEDTTQFSPQNSKKLLLIFTRNPELGKCKSRLAATVGNQNALDIYKFLLNHTATLTKDVNATKQVWYSEEIWENDIWNNHTFDKKLQHGADLGARMAHAFQEGFAAGFERIIIIGSDMYDLTKADINNAFTALKKNDYVIGPAEDGGYYLLGMTTFKESLFQNKSWGTETVLQHTLADLNEEKTTLLDTRNDVDYYKDIKNIDAFSPYLKNI